MEIHVSGSLAYSGYRYRYYQNTDNARSVSVSVSVNVQINTSPGSNSNSNSHSQNPPVPSPASVKPSNVKPDLSASTALTNLQQFLQGLSDIRSFANKCKDYSELLGDAKALEQETKYGKMRCVILDWDEDLVQSSKEIKRKTTGDSTMSDIVSQDVSGSQDKNSDYELHESIPKENISGEGAVKPETEINSAEGASKDDIGHAENASSGVTQSDSPSPTGILLEAPDSSQRLTKDQIHMNEVSLSQRKVYIPGDFGGWKVPVEQKTLPHSKASEDELAIWLSQMEEMNLGVAHTVPLFHLRKLPSGHILTIEKAHSNLHRKVVENDDNQMSDMLPLLYDAAKGVKWLHEKKIAHRELTPQNILLFLYGNKEVAKVGGFTRSLKAFDETEFSSDIFKLGTTFYFALSGGRDPFEDGSHPENAIGYHKMIPAHDANPQLKSLEANVTANHLVHWMLAKPNPKSGISIDHVLHHPMFYSTLKKLDFLLAVASAFDNKQVDAIRSLRESVNRAYLELHPDFNFISNMGAPVYELLRRRRTSQFLKHYDAANVIDLVELVRDKHLHYQDHTVELISLIGRDGIYHPEGLVSFVLSVAADLVIFLFLQLVKADDDALKALKLSERFSLNIFSKYIVENL